MKTYSFLILALILFCASCSMRSSQTRARLEHIDSLIVGGMFEDADSELAEFDADNITDEDGRALYSLMKAQMSLVSGRGLASNSLLTYSRRPLRAVWRRGAPCPCAVLRGGV